MNLLSRICCAWALAVFTSTAFAALEVHYKAGDTSAVDNSVKPHLMIVNTGAAPAALSELTLR
jgi:hypothetical protein